MNSSDLWGPYVAERAWGSVREDYSENGDAWNYFTHDHARKRAYRWGDDGIAGICDRYQILIFSPAFWNGKDPILKERLFGLNSDEGNHGEDVKELYYYLDASPTANYLKYLYKYPQEAFPYDRLVEENRRRGPKDREFELVDTGAFDQNKYFDIFVEYAKADPEDICIRIEAVNRGPKPAALHLLPQLWFRNQWAWGEKRGPEPRIQVEEGLLVADGQVLPSPRPLLHEYNIGKRFLSATPGYEALFTNNDSNAQDLWNTPNATPYVKDAFHRYLIHGDKQAANPKKTGTKAALHYFFPAVEKSVIIYLRLAPKASSIQEVDAIIAKRKAEADQFYEGIHPKRATDEEKAIQRASFAGMIWNQQIYNFCVNEWLNGDNLKAPPPPGHKMVRNCHWRHLLSMQIFSMPDKWEYPWFAAWDLTFHSLTLALIDLPHAKEQFSMLFRDQFQHPSGAFPAYEWEFSDVNPPVQAWAALKLFEMDQDYEYLEMCFHRLLINFAWWINKVDELGNNIFEGGFLGMDNIGFSDRSQKPPPGFLLDQADGSGWMSLLCLNLMRIALTLSKKDPNYQGLACKFLWHFIYITAAMRKGYWRNYDMWCEEDGFFYSYFRHPDGTAERFDARSLVGIIPFFACDVWDEEELRQFPLFWEQYEQLIYKKPHLADKCIQKVSETKHVFGLLSKEELEKFLKNIWSPDEFRSPYGLRSLSKVHEKHPAVMHGMTLSYEPGEALEKIKGGNSNWRGPIWFPINYLLIETLLNLSDAFKDTIQIKVGSEEPATLHDMAQTSRK